MKCRGYGVTEKGKMKKCGLSLWCEFYKLNNEKNLKFTTQQSGLERRLSTPWPESIPATRAGDDIREFAMTMGRF